MSRGRITTIFVFFLFLFVVVEARLFQIQVLNSEKYKNLAKKQYQDFSVLPARRGDIVTSDGYVLAGTQIHYLMYAEPQRVVDKYKLAHDLADLVSKLHSKTDDSESGESAKQRFAELYDKYLSLLTGDLKWVGLERNVTPTDKEEIEKAGFEGIGFEDVPERFYSEKTLGSHILGFVASNETGEKQGYFGVEGKLNEDLRGRSGRIVEDRDALGIPILSGEYKKVASLPGRSVVLTINRSVQYLVEKRLKEGVEKYGAKSGTAVVMDPLTSSIIAMANYPTYSPDNFAEETDEQFAKAGNTQDVFRKKVERTNLAIAQTYEPGSVIKPLTISAAIEEKLVSPSTTYVDAGPVWYSGHVIDNWDGKHYGLLDIVQLLQKSNNIGAAWVGTQVGNRNLHRYFSDFGFGKTTGVELEGEDTGILRDPGTWTDIDLATISFGQGVSATPLQIINAFNVFANGGYLFEPKIISKMIDDGKQIEVPPRFVKKVISKQTAETMVDMLEKAAEGGEAKFYVLKSYRIAGKTGTAQIPIEGKYDSERTNATFAGFLPGSNKFSMIIKLEEPQISIYAAETTVPLWMETANDLVNYYNLPPDKQGGSE